MSLRPQLEAIIYAAETPISLDQIYSLVKESVLAETPGIEPAEIKSRIRATLEELIASYSAADHGIEIRQVAGGYRMSTKPDQHDVVRAFAKSLKPPFRLSLPALETLAVIAYKQPVTVPEISEIRGVDSGGVIATLLDRKLITTAGRKAVIGRPILYKTSKDFLLRFGLKDINELPSMEEFEKLLAESFQSDLLPSDSAPVESLSASPSTSGLILRRLMLRSVNPRSTILPKPKMWPNSPMKKRRKRQPAPNRSSHPCQPNVCKKLSLLPEWHRAARPKP